MMDWEVVMLPVFSAPYAATQTIKWQNHINKELSSLNFSAKNDV